MVTHGNLSLGSDGTRETRGCQSCTARAPRGKALSYFQTPGLHGKTSNHSQIGAAAGTGLLQWGEGAGRKGDRRDGEGSLQAKAQIAGGIVHFFFFW